MCPKWTVTILLFFHIFIFCQASELLSVVTIFRHGARAPAFLYPTDPYNKIASEIWPDGLAQLTKLGKQQQYNFGQWLRERYKNFIPDLYNPTFLYVMSSNTDRCLMSASSNLAGLFPPKGHQVWNENLLWQPIPIHTIPETEDVLLIPGKICPKHVRLMQELYNTTSYKNYYKEHKFIFDFISNYTGFPIATPENVLSIYDILSEEAEKKLLLPDWAKLVYPQPSLSIAEYSFLLPTFTPQLARLKSGPLIDYISTFFEKVISNPETSQKFLMMSGHDITLAYLLTSLKIYDNTRPEYTSSVIFELRKNKNDTFVNIYFKNSTSLHMRQLPNCTPDCRLNKFQKIIEPVRVNISEWEKECIKEENPASNP